MSSCQKFQHRSNTKILACILLFSFATTICSFAYIRNFLVPYSMENHKYTLQFESDTSTTRKIKIVNNEANGLDLVHAKPKTIDHTLHTNEKKAPLPPSAPKPILLNQKSILPVQSGENLPKNITNAHAPENHKSSNVIEKEKSVSNQIKPVAVKARKPPIQAERKAPRTLNGSIVPKRYWNDEIAYEKYKSYLYQTEEILPKQTKAVIILTNHRSGSSFFGQLFNQHPDAFYLFEPLFPISVSSDCSRSEMKNDVLSLLLQCKLPNWSTIYNSIPQPERIKTSGNLKLCFLQNFCFRSFSKQLCEEKHCPARPPGEMSDAHCNINCGKVNPILAMNDCRRKEMVAMKLIRLCDILSFKNIIEQTNVDVKILHLIRDPRGIANSRQMLIRRLNLKESIYNTCKRQSHNIDVGAINTPDWLKGRYKLFRYEDVATSPYEIAQSVYDFVGLKFTDGMKDWIAKNTDIQYSDQESDIGTSESLETEENTISENTNRRKREVMPNQSSSVKGNEQKQKVVNPVETKRKPIQANQKPQRSNPYGTTRNSTTVVQKWAKRLPYITVRMIESVCEDVMKWMGYVKVNGVNQYRLKDSNTKYFTDKIHVLNNA